MSRPSAGTSWIPVTALVLFGCYLPAVQHVSSVAPFAVEVRDGQPAEVQFDRGAPVSFVRIRVVGDTLYGWEYPENRVPPESVAVHLRRVLTIKQQHLDVAETLSTIGFVVALLGAAYVAALIKFLD